MAGGGKVYARTDDRTGIGKSTLPSRSERGSQLIFVFSRATAGLYEAWVPGPWAGGLLQLGEPGRPRGSSCLPQDSPSLRQDKRSSEGGPGRCWGGISGGGAGRVAPPPAKRLRPARPSGPESPSGRSCGGGGRDYLGGGGPGDGIRTRRAGRGLLTAGLGSF